jgi:hypothetical protein
MPFLAHGLHAGNKVFIVEGCVYVVSRNGRREFISNDRVHILQLT